MSHSNVIVNHDVANHDGTFGLWRIAACFALTCAACIFLNASAYAQTGSPMGDVLCLIVDWMVGNLGWGLATIGISAVGIGAILGKISWGVAFTVMVGCVVMLNATLIVAQMGIPVVSC